MDEIGLFFWEPLECPAWPMEDEALEGVGRWLNMESLAVEEFWPYWTSDGRRLPRSARQLSAENTSAETAGRVQASWGVDWGEALFCLLVILMGLAMGRLVGGG